MKKPTLCVIFGGKSSEYEVSLRSAYAVLSHLSKEKYDIVRLGITKGSEWYLYEGENERILNDTWQGEGTVAITVDVSNGHLIALGREMYAIHIDLILPVLHGGYGEDGRLQGLFEIAGVRCVGCPSFCSHICMDKSLTKALAASLGIKVARSYKKGDTLEYPVFVKPKMGGSSVGAMPANNEKELEAALENALPYGDVLVEEHIGGFEVEVGVLERNREIIVSPVGMIRHKSRFYDYETKYMCGENEYLIPAPIDEKTGEEIREKARQLFIGLGCKGLGRFDFFVTRNREAVFNEVNTLPGFTDISMFPKLFMSMGYSFEALLDIIIENELKER